MDVERFRVSTFSFYAYPAPECRTRGIKGYQCNSIGKPGLVTVQRRDRCPDWWRWDIIFRIGVAHLTATGYNYGSPQLAARAAWRWWQSRGRHIRTRMRP